MASKLEILGQVMLSFKSDQNEAMNNINALLNTRDTEKDLISNIKDGIGRLSIIHNAMQETEAFILQLTANNVKPTNDKENSGK